MFSKLLNMGPTASVKNIFYTCNGNIKAICQCFNRQILAAKQSYKCHIFFKKNMCSIFLSPKMSLPTFLISILHVFLMRSKKQMFGINASRIVAFMKDMKACGNRAIVNDVRSSVRSYVFPIFLQITTTAPLIKEFKYPASFRFNCFIKESFFKAIGFWSTFPHVGLLIKGVNYV